MLQPPQHVMRFYGDVKYALECIAFKQITFLHRNKLNDPFDPYYYFETDFNDDYEEIINHLKQHHADNLHHFKQRMPKQNWERFLKQTRERLNWNYNNTFIFSAIEVSKRKHPKDNLYMWSHYGAGHSGVAIKFDTHLLEKAVLENLAKPDSAVIELDGIWSEINYQNEPQKITCDHIVNDVMDWDGTKIGEVMNQMFSSKCMVWQTEKEWRLMLRNDETTLKIQRLDLLDDTVTAVYLGCRIADNIENDLILETKRNFTKAEIFKARKAKGKFALDFERIMGPANSNLAEHGNWHAKNT